MINIRNLLDFGGNGNGVADNSPAFAAAIADILAEPNGASLFVPAGKYHIATQVVFPKTANKSIHVFGEWGSTIISCASVASSKAAFYVGGALAAGGTNFRVSDMSFVGGGTTAGTAFELKNANGAQFEGVSFNEMRDGVLMDASYAVSFLRCQAVNVGRIMINSSTSCHNLVIDRFKAYNVGLASNGRFLHVAGHTDNIVIQNSDFEYCYQVYSLADGGASLYFCQNYVEGTSTLPFSHTTAMYGASINNNFIGMGANFSIPNMKGGEFKRNRLHQQQVGFATSSVDVGTADNHAPSPSVLTPCQPTTVTAFLNGSSVGARPVAYQKDSNGYIHLYGEARVGTNGAPIFALPSFYYPMRTQRLNAIDTVDNSNVYVIVDAVNGNVVPTCSSPSLRVSLDGLAFRAAK